MKHALAPILLTTLASAQVAVTLSNPTPALEGLAAFEPNSGEGWLFPAGSNTLWRYDAGHWLPVSTPLTLPSPLSAVCTWANLGVLVTGAGQSWLWNGASWSPALVGAPPPSGLKAITHDPARNVLVAVAGNQSLVEVHEFDGTSWQLRPSPTLLPNHPWMQMTWDPIGQRSVLSFSDGWMGGAYAWNGASWTFLQVHQRPGASLATAPGLGGVVMCGGYSFPFTSSNRLLYAGSPGFQTTFSPRPSNTRLSWFDPVRNHTVVTSPRGDRSSWFWDGSVWSQPQRGKEVPRGATFAYDSWRGRVLAYGEDWFFGYEGNELWELVDGQAEPLGTGPSPRKGQAMTFDSTRGVLIVFGGCRGDDGSGSTLQLSDGNTYEWDGATWTAIPTPSWSGPADPRYRCNALMAFDRHRNRTVMFGGEVRTATGWVRRDDTFEWNGMTWQHLPVLAPPTNASSLSYVAAHQRCVMLSGAELVGWDGTTWSSLNIPPIPPGPPSTFFRASYDESRGLWLADSQQGPWELAGGAWQPAALGATTAPFDLSIGRFHGMGSFGAFRYGDQAAATLRPLGAGCQGSAGVPVLHGEDAPRLGRVVPVTLARAPQNAPFFGLLGQETPSWLGLSLPIDLGQIGMTGCTLLTPIDVGELRSGTVWPVAIPNQATLLGARFRLQAFVMDAGSNPLGATTSNALAMRIGS